MRRNPLRFLVLPVPKNLPPRRTQTHVDCYVSRPIASQLWPPVVAIALRVRTVIWTAVPETAVNKDGDADSRKNDVGPDNSAWEADGAVDEKAKTIPVQTGSNCEFWSGVATRVQAHPP
jgi:hypothetical protein